MTACCKKRHAFFFPAPSSFRLPGNPSRDIVRYNGGEGKLSWNKKREEDSVWRSFLPLSSSDVKHHSYGTSKSLSLQYLFWI